MLVGSLKCGCFFFDVHMWYIISYISQTRCLACTSCTHLAGKSIFVDHCFVIYAGTLFMEV
jgi:hypothetical protein